MSDAAGPTSDGSETDAAQAGPAGEAHMATSERLRRLAAEAPGERVSLGWILDAIHERAFGVFLLVLALPCCIPFLYGVPQVVALPMLAVTAQMAAGRRAPWLPAGLRRREIAVASLEKMTARATPYLTFLERFSRPRLTVLTARPLDMLLGAALTLFAASILVPLPGTNTVPGIAVAIAAVGLLERDGLLAALGIVLGLSWIGVLIGAGGWVIGLIFGG